MARRKSNKQAKQLLDNFCLRVSDNGEVSWVNKVHLMADGAVTSFSTYLGEVDCPNMMAKVVDRLHIKANREEV